MPQNPRFTVEYLDEAIMNIISHEDLLNEIIGSKGTEEHKAYDAEVQAQVDLFNMGEAIKTARIQRGLSQEQLGELIGVKRSRMCQIEKGIGLTLSTIARSLRAINVNSNIVMDGVGTYSLA